FEYVTKATSDAIWDYEVKTGKMFWGEGFQTLFGYKNFGEKKEYKDWSEKVHPDDIERVERRADEILGGSESTYQQEYRFQRSDGTYAIVLDKAVVLRDNKGRVERLIGAIADITERKLRELQKTVISGVHFAFNRSSTIEEALEHTIKLIQNIDLFALAEVWMVDNSRENIVLTASMNSTSEIKFFYKETAEMNSFKIGEGMPGHVWGKKSDLFWENIGKKKNFIRRDSAIKLGIKSVFGFPILDNNEVLGVILFGVNSYAKRESYYSALSNDLSVALGLEISRNRLEKELKLIFDSAPDIICVAGFDGYFKKVNPAMSDLLGYSEMEILNTPILDFTHPDDRAKTKEEFEKLKREKGNRLFENRYITKSGNVVCLSWTTKPIYDKGIT
ncbi:MAG: PAS domain-containing protein, partial [Candidatus Paceibacterota bacterium]